MEKDLRAQEILMESIKDPLVAGLETSKEIYNNFLELFSKYAINKVMSLKSNLHKFSVSKDKGLCS